MPSRAEHLTQVAAALDHVPEIAALIAWHRQLVDAAERVTRFHNAYRPPGRLTDLIDNLARALEVADLPDDPRCWDAVEWRRRCAAAGVAQVQALRVATDLANDAGLDRPYSLHAIPPEIAGDVAERLHLTAERTTT